jgi:hypothetical protein
MNMMRDFLKWLLLALAAFVLLLFFQKKGDGRDSRSQDSPAIVRQTADQERLADSLSAVYYQDVQFAFTDSTGLYLICGGDDSLSRAPYVLVTSEGETLPLRYVEHRRESKQSTDRQTMNNFRNTGGTVFLVESRTLIPDKTYLVVSSKFLTQHCPLRLIENDRPDVDSVMIERITRRRGRSIQKSWPIGILDTFGPIVVVWFGNEGDHPLASLIVVQRDSLIFEDYIGDESREGSIWRVDDGGEFFGDAINVIAAFSSPEGIVLARTWGGAEGENDELLQQSKDRFFSLVDSYRYWVPE